MTSEHGAQPSAGGVPPPLRSRSLDDVPPGALRVIAVLVRERHLLWRYPFAVTLIVVLLSFLFPNSYKSSVSVLPPERDFQTMSVPMGDLKSLAIGGMALPLMATPSDILAAVITSRTVRDSVVVRLSLARHWGTTFPKAVKALESGSGVKVAQTGIIDAWATSTDRFFADTLANALVDEADRLNRAIVNTKGRRTREFVEKRLEETKSQLVTATDALRQFQRENHTVALEAQVSALVENAAKLKAQLTADEIELSVLEGSLSSEHYRVQQLSSRIRETRRHLDEMEQTAVGDSTQGSGGGISGLPRLGQQLAEKLRDVKIAEALYMLLTEQYENARIQERRDTPSFSILDHASGGGVKVRPKRTVLGAATFVVALGLVIALVMVREFFARLAVTDPERHRATRAIWESLRQTRRQK